MWPRASLQVALLPGESPVGTRMRDSPVATVATWHVEQVHGFPANKSSHLALLVVSGPGPGMRCLSVPLAAGFDHHHLARAPHAIMWARYPPCVPSVSSGHHAFSSPPARGQIDLPGAACLRHSITVRRHSLLMTVTVTVTVTVPGRDGSESMAMACGGGARENRAWR